MHHYGYFEIDTNISYTDLKYSAKNKKGKESKNWETQYKNIWSGKKR